MSQRLNTPLFGIDYTSPIPTNVLKAAGVRFVYRYVSHSESKNLQKQEAEQLKAAGIGICLVFEDWGFTKGVESRDQGVSDAQYALNFAYDRVGRLTTPRPICFAVDTDSVSPAEADPYFEGVATILPRGATGPYGSKNMVSYFADRGFGCLFQTYAWSNGALDTRALVHQYSNSHTINGHSVDFDHAFYEDYGQWNYHPLPPSDPFTVLLDQAFTFGGQRINERRTARQSRNLLSHPKNKQTRARLQESHRRLKLLRDRITLVSGLKHGQPPVGAPFQRRERWGILNHQINVVAKAARK